MFCEVLESLGPNRGQRLSVVSEALITSIMVVIKEYSITMYFLSLLMTEDFLSCLGPMVKIYLDTWTNEQSGHYMSNL